MNCPICHNTDTQHYMSAKDYELCTTEKTYHYNLCNHCGSIFITEFPLHELDIIYPPHYYSNQGGSQKTSAVTAVKEYLDQRHFKKILGRIKSGSISVLDVGGGSGWLLDIVKKCSARVKKTTVVDLDPSAEALAKQKGHVFHRMPIEALETTEKFDFIMLLNLIEHVSNPALVLEKINTLLCDEGLLLIKTPNTDSWDRRLFKKFYWGGLHCPRHWILFNRESLTRVLHQSGFKITAFNYTQGAPQWTQSVLCTLSNFGIFKISKEKPIMAHPLMTPLLIFFAVFDFLRGRLFKTSQMFLLVQKDPKHR